MEALVRTDTQETEWEIKGGLRLGTHCAADYPRLSQFPCIFPSFSLCSPVPLIFIPPTSVIRKCRLTVYQQLSRVKT